MVQTRQTNTSSLFFFFFPNPTFLPLLATLLDSPVNPLMIPALAFLYSPLTSLFSHSSSGVLTKISKKGRCRSRWILRAISRSWNWNEAGRSSCCHCQAFFPCCCCCFVLVLLVIVVLVVVKVGHCCTCVVVAFSTTIGNNNNNKKKFLSSKLWPTKSQPIWQPLPTFLKGETNEQRATTPESANSLPTWKKKNVQQVCMYLVGTGRQMMIAYLYPDGTLGHCSGNRKV